MVYKLGVIFFLVCGGAFFEVGLTTMGFTLLTCAYLVIAFIITSE